MVLRKLYNIFIGGFIVRMILVLLLSICLLGLGISSPANAITKQSTAQPTNNEQVDEEAGLIMDQVDTNSDQPTSIDKADSKINHNKMSKACLGVMIGYAYGIGIVATLAMYFYQKSYVGCLDK